MDTLREKTKEIASAVSVPLSQLIAAARWCDALGFPSAELLAAARLPADLLAKSPQSHVDLALQGRLYDIIAERAGDRCLFDAALHALPASFSVSELPLLVSPDLGSMQACIERCWQQPRAGIAVQCARLEPDRVLLTVQDHCASPLRWYTLLGTWLRLLGALGMQVRQLLLPLPPPQQRWIEDLCGEVSFHNVLLQIGALVPETAFASGNPIAFQWLLERSETSIAPLDLESLVRQEIRVLLQRNEPLSIREIARNTALSTRTLQRRLQEEGLRFRSLVSSERCAFAARLLQDSDISVKQIATRVGFEGTSSFDRAFSLWSGATPVEWRERKAKR